MLIHGPGPNPDPDSGDQIEKQLHAL
jgi:hypothetical protein